jgi:hypothetical protein
MNPGLRLAMRGGASILALLLCGLPTGVAAQVTTATIQGAVQDAQGGAIPGATVVLVSERQNTRSAPAVTTATGDFVLTNVSPDTYTIEVTMSGFKTLRRAGVAVSPGDRVSLGKITIELGGVSEVVNVTSEAPLVQAASGERSFSVPTASVENLPIANRSFIALTSLTPGVSGNARIGGGGGNNTMVDGVSAIDTGGGNLIVQVSVESIEEVKVLTSGYQAEYGRSSGLQIAAVTKSGTNQFRGSLYGVFRDSAWNANSRQNILNGDPKATLRQRDVGYSIGGPVGKPGGANKLFFFYSHEFSPRSQGGGVNRFRVPTARERAGDFSQTYDNNGALFPFIKDPLLTGACSAANTAGCFKDGGVVGKIPTNRFYAPGLAVLNLYPLPNIDGAGLAYNYEEVQPTERALSHLPTVRVDYRPTSALRVSWKYSGFRQPTDHFRGSLPGITESAMYHPSSQYTWSLSGNYTLGPKTFLEVTYGGSQNQLTGCALAAAGAQTGPAFCTSGIPTGALSNRDAAGLSGLPRIFADDPALVLRQDYFAYEALSSLQPPMFVNGLLLRTPNFTWGGRVANAPPNVPFAGFLNRNQTNDIVVSLTRVTGRHTIKAGFYNSHSLKAQQQNSNATFGTYNFTNSTSNPLDTGFPYANALVGIVNSFNQQSTYIEGQYVYNNTEGYIQDNWKVNSRLTLDYGVRLVHQQPQYDRLGQASNFLPSQYDLAAAPSLYQAGCANGAPTCTGTNRQAKNPATGTFLGPGSAVAIGTIVPNTGDPTNGLFLSGHGIAKTTYTWPALGVAPRFGAAYDVRGDQRVILRGGFGLFFDRPVGNSVFGQVLNPPAVTNVTVNFANLANPLSGTQGAPSLSVFEYAGGLPPSTQWNTGVQMTLPWSSALDLAYVGQHAWNQYQSVNLNAIDFGAAFLPQFQDPTQTPTFLGSNVVANDQMRAFRGYGNINQQWSRGTNTYHSVQVSFQRRFTNGLSFGFNDTWSLSNKDVSAARLQHNSDGTYAYRPDQAEADALLQDDPVRHTLKGNFVWDLPDLKGEGVRRLIGAAVNDWQLSGVWTASTGAPYTVGFSYQNGGSNANLTGSPDYAARIRILGDPGHGCSGDIYRQFNTAVFAGPLPGSVGLESGANYLKGCFQSALDLALARNIRLGGTRALQVRVDIFNAPNAAIITGRVTTLQLNDPGDPITPRNAPFDPTTGQLIETRSLPKNAGFGVANAYQSPRTVQLQVRFSF